MNKKVMAIIYSERGNFLLLKMNPKWLHEEGWFVVTGSCDGDSLKEAVKREIEEETGIKEILSIKPTEYFCEYEWPKGSGKMHDERAFLVKVKEQPIRLSGEHLDYKWLNKEDFLKEIRWQDDINKLKKILAKKNFISIKKQ
jgi:8-oxo-dGTP pyrophosphatase MutT (NUDIX family)